jgi:multiple sugar transport system ATP-binding protein
VVKRYKSVTAVDHLNIEIQDREFAVLVGPSGCGKTTALRMIAGLEEITAGEIRIGERRVNDMPPKERDIAMVFQNYALYPHMSVRENLGFGLKMRNFPRREIETRVEEAAEILGIRELLDRKPKALSGGQRQRVAVGRAIVRKPQVFLFDEPLSNLDAKLRVAMRAEISKLHRRLRINGEDALTARVEVVEPLGAEMLVHLACGAQTIVARLEMPAEPFSVGQSLNVRIKMLNTHLFDGETMRTLV